MKIQSPRFKFRPISEKKMRCYILTAVDTAIVGIDSAINVICILLSLNSAYPLYQCLCGCLDQQCTKCCLLFTVSTEVILFFFLWFSFFFHVLQLSKPNTRICDILFSFVESDNMCHVCDCNHLVYVLLFDQIPSSSPSSKSQSQSL